MNDDQLIEKTLAGDRSAFGQLVVLYQDRLFTSMLHIAGSHEDALDVVQEAFTQAFLHLDTFRQSSRFYTWLYRIAFNIAVGIRRKRKPVVSIEGAFDDAARNLPDELNSPLDFAGNNEMREILWGAINRLDEEYRGSIILREIEGYSYDEIALILEVPVGTVRSRLHRARNILKEMLFRHQRDF